MKHEEAWKQYLQRRKLVSPVNALMDKMRVSTRDKERYGWQLIDFDCRYDAWTIKWDGKYFELIFNTEKFAPKPCRWIECQQCGHRLIYEKSK